MRKRFTIGGVAAIALAAAVFYAAPFQATPQPLAGLFPAGAALYLEAKDFSADLRDWNASDEQKRWLASTRYEGFARSNLFLKLQAAAAEFTGAAGFAPDSALLQSLAGGQSALAIYDIGELQFLYVTRISSASAMQTALWQSRAKYQTRHAGGVDFFVHVDSGRTVAFASTRDYLVLGTREELVAGALRLLAGEALTPVRQEAWYADTTAAASAPGDLRLVMNLEALTKSPQFRTYWIQRNVAEVRRYRAGIADLVRSAGEIREERVFLRAAAAPAVTGNAVALVRLAPDSAAFCHAWANPTAEDVSALLEQKILAPRVTAPLSQDFAPPVDVPTDTGDEADLETRIDETPLTLQASQSAGDLQRLFASVPLVGAVEVQSGESLPDGVFVVTPTVLAIEAARPWDEAAARNVLASGQSWTAHQRGARTWYGLDGLGSLQIAVAGNLLLVANSEQALGAVLDRIDLRPEAADTTSVALFRHAAARAEYRKIMQMLDHGQPRVFFSDDLWSLSGIFEKFREVEVRTRDAGASLRETVHYRR
jgi:hypothetical protein